MSAPARRAGTALLALLVSGLLAACSGPGAPTPSSSTPTSGPATSAVPTSSAPVPTSAAPSPSATSTVVRAVTTHAFGIPTVAAPFTTVHAIRPPIAPPPAPPLPCLRQISVGRHPEASPAYDQISFRFSGALPGYEVAYVSSLTAPGSGKPVPIPGSAALLRVRFRSAQAHDEQGRSSVVAPPPHPIGYAALKDYALVGDFEGVVEYGLGIAVRPHAGAAGRVRTVEVERIEGGTHVFVVAVQITTG